MKTAWTSLCAGATLIVLLTAITYIPALRGGLIWDDSSKGLISENSMVKASDGLYRFWFTSEAVDYWPLTQSLWWVEWRLWGDHALGYQVINVLLHAVNAVLVWIILWRLKIPGAWVAGLVFAIHPVNVATAAWISEQKNTLSMLFYATSILLYLRFDEERHWRWYGLSLAAFLLALFGKTAVVMLPVVLLGCVWWMRGRVQVKDFLCSVPFFVFSLVLGLVTIRFQSRTVLATGTAPTDSVLSRLIAAGRVPWFYLQKALLPYGLCEMYPKWHIDDSLWISYLPGTALIVCLAFLWWKRSTWGRAAFFALGYFVVSLFPVLGFFDQSFHRYSLVNDHWQYLSIVGIIGLVVAAGVTISRRTGARGQSVGVLACVVLLMILGVATCRRASVYADAETLWRDNVAKNPEAFAGHHNLGVVLAQVGKLEEAVGHFELALVLKPDFAEAHYNLGCAFAQLGRIQEAIGQLKEAVHLDPNNAHAHNNLANALAQSNRIPEAVHHYEQALRIKPDSAEVHYDLGLAWEQAGEIEKAIKQYKQALKFKPDMLEAKEKLEQLQPAL